MYGTWVSVDIKILTPLAHLEKTAGRRQPGRIAELHHAPSSPTKSANSAPQHHDDHRALRNIPCPFAAAAPPEPLHGARQHIPERARASDPARMWKFTLSSSSLGQPVSTPRR